jgi:hypothetical protein
MLSQSVGADQVAEVIARWTGIPVTKLTKSDKEKLLNLSEELHRRVIGQVWRRRRFLFSLFSFLFLVYISIPDSLF